MIIKEGDTLLRYLSRAVRSCCSMQAEAQALHEGIMQAIQLGIHECDFYTDCKELQEKVSRIQPPIQSDWRICKEVFEIWKLLNGSTGYRCYFADRSYNKLADYLAKNGRIESWDVMGCTFPLFK